MGWLNGKGRAVALAVVVLVSLVAWAVIHHWRKVQDIALQSQVAASPAKASAEAMEHGPVYSSPHVRAMRLLILLELQGGFCEETAARVTALTGNPDAIHLSGDRFMEDERVQVGAGTALVNGAAEALAGDSSPAAVALLDLYEEETKLCELAARPQGSYANA